MNSWLDSGSWIRLEIRFFQWPLTSRLYSLCYYLPRKDVSFWGNELYERFSAQCCISSSTIVLAFGCKRMFQWEKFWNLVDVGEEDYHVYVEKMKFRTKFFRHSVFPNRGDLHIVETPRKKSVRAQRNPAYGLLRPVT